MKRTALFLATAAAVAAAGSARAQTYVATAPAPGLAPSYANWTTFDFKDRWGGTEYDYGIATLALPFDFTFYGKVYRSLDITEDGLIIFENGTPKYCNGSYVSACSVPVKIPSTAKPNGFIAFWWNDMRSNTAQGVYTLVGATVGDRIFSIKLDNWTNDYTGGERSVQIDLHERDGVIAIYYGQLNPNTTTEAAAAGIEDSTGANGLVVLPCANALHRCDQPDWPASQYVLISKPAPDLMVGGVTGSPLVPVPDVGGGKPGYKLDVTVEIRNQGQLDANGFTYDLYLCNVPYVDTVDTTKCQPLGSHATAESLAAMPSRDQFRA